MGIIRTRATIEQQSSNEVEQPLLKKLCPFVDTPVGEEESESYSGGEEHEDSEESESESDSGKEEDGSSTVNQECLNNDHKESMGVSEEEQDDSSESESVGDSEESNSREALDLLEGGGKVVQSKSTTEKNEEFKSQELCPEVDHPLVAHIVASEDVKPESDSAEGEENSFSGDSSNNYEQNKVVNEEEDDESSESESKGDTEASDEQDSLGEKLRDDNNKQMTVVSEKEEDGSSGSESDGDIEASTGQNDMELGEKLTNNSHKQSRMVIEKDDDGHNQSRMVIEEEEDTSSGSESEGNSEASNDHVDLDLGGGEEQNMTRGNQSRATTEKHQDSKSQEPCSKIGSLQAKKLSPSSVASNEEDDGGEEKSESDPTERDEEKSSESDPTERDEEKSSDTYNGDEKLVNKEYSHDNHKKTLEAISGNEEEGDESESKGDTETSCEQEDLHLLRKKKQSNVAQPEPNVGKHVKKSHDSKPAGEKNHYSKWSDDDVITLLEGLVKIKIMDGGGKGTSYVPALRDLIVNSINFEPTVHQIREKIRRLRIKYVKYKYVRRSRVNLSPHEARVVELCQKVWGNELKTKIVAQSRLSTGSFRNDYCSQAREILEEGFDFITRSKNQSDFEEDWVKLHLQEIQLYQEKLDMMKKHLDQVTNELQASLRSGKKADQTSPYFLGC